MEYKHGVKLPSLTFESLKMPREYNFNTDVIYCHIGIADALKLYNRVTFPNTDKLAQLLKDNFTSSSGFHSFYSNELEDYLSKSIEQLDHNELGILFPVPESDEFFTLWENSACNGFFTNVINFCSEP